MNRVSSSPNRLLLNPTGKYGQGSRFFLQTNNLERFESGVFQDVLEQMAPFANGTSLTASYIWIDQSTV